MGTTKDNLMAVVTKLIDDVNKQNQANASKVAADGFVVSALQSQATASAEHAAATGIVQSDLTELQKVAAAMADEDDAT